MRQNGKVFQFQILHSNLCVATKLKGRDGLSSETLDTIAATWIYLFTCLEPQIYEWFFRLRSASVMNFCGPMVISKLEKPSWCLAKNMNS